MGGYQGLQHFGSMAWVGQLPALLRLVLAVPIVVWVSNTAVAALSAQMAATTVSIAAGTWVLMRALRRHASAPSIETDSGGAYFLAAAFVLVSFSMLVVTDVLLAKRFFDPTVAGRYAQSATIARAVFFLPLPIAGVLFPKVASEGELRPEAKSMVMRALLYTAALLAGVGLVAVFFLDLVWQMFTGQPPRPEQTTWVVRLMFAMVPLAFTFLLVNFAMARKSFGPLFGLPLCAAAYAGLAAWRHRDPSDLIRALLVGGLLALVFSAWAAFRPSGKTAGAPERTGSL
jgi:O-antigen/teichoic acid export membrane protein